MRKILYPFSLLYAAVMRLRNLFYDKGWLRSFQFGLPVIAVGNLSVGGTGKSPMIEYLIRQLQTEFDLVVLSRGYGRKTKGFILAGPDSDARRIGDEPYQFYRKFRGIGVAVDEDRAHGVTQLLSEKPTLDAILLDDAFQHRRIRAGLNILMTSYERLYTEDLVLPAGDLREPRSGAQRADIIVVSKCPLDLSDKEMRNIRSRLKPGRHQELFFTGIDYAKVVRGSEGTLSLSELSSREVLLVTGIAHPEPMIHFLGDLNVNFRHMRFSDHHRLRDSEFKEIQADLNRFQGKGKIVLTTEKDFVRNFEDTDLPVYYLPMQTVFLEGEERFKKRIDDYVRKN